MDTPKHLTPIQAAAFEDIAREIMIGEMADVSTAHRQRAAFRKLHRADALAVAGAIFDAGLGGKIGDSPTAQVDRAFEADGAL